MAKRITPSDLKQKGITPGRQVGASATTFNTITDPRTKELADIADALGPLSKSLSTFYQGKFKQESLEEIEKGKEWRRNSKKKFRQAIKDNDFSIDARSVNPWFAVGALEIEAENDAAIFSAEIENELKQSYETGGGPNNIGSDPNGYNDYIVDKRNKFFEDQGENSPYYKKAFNKIIKTNISRNNLLHGRRVQEGKEDRIKNNYENAVGGIIFDYNNKITEIDETPDATILLPETVNMMGDDPFEIKSLLKGQQKAEFISKLQEKLDYEHDNFPGLNLENKFVDVIIDEASNNKGKEWAYDILNQLKTGTGKLIDKDYVKNTLREKDEELLAQSASIDFNERYVQLGLFESQIADPNLATPDMAQKILDLEKRGLYTPKEAKRLIQVLDGTLKEKNEAIIEKQLTDSLVAASFSASKEGFPPDFNEFKLTLKRRNVKTNLSDYEFKRLFIDIKMDEIRNDSSLYTGDRFNSVVAKFSDEGYDQKESTEKAVSYIQDEELYKYSLVSNLKNQLHIKDFEKGYRELRFSKLDPDNLSDSGLRALQLYELYKNSNDGVGLDLLTTDANQKQFFDSMTSNLNVNKNNVVTAAEKARTPVITIGKTDRKAYDKAFEEHMSPDWWRFFGLFGDSSDPAADFESLPPEYKDIRKFHFYQDIAPKVNELQSLGYSLDTSLRMAMKEMRTTRSYYNKNFVPRIPVFEGNDEIQTHVFAIIADEYEEKWKSIVEDRKWDFTDPLGGAFKKDMLLGPYDGMKLNAEDITFDFINDTLVMYDANSGDQIYGGDDAFGIKTEFSSEELEDVYKDYLLGKFDSKWTKAKNKLKRIPGFIVEGLGTFFFSKERGLPSITRKIEEKLQSAAGLDESAGNEND